MVFSNITQSEWKFPDYYKEPWKLLPSPEDFAITMGVAIFLTVARVYVQSATMKLAQRLSVKETVKFSESCWKSLYYVPCTAIGLTLVLPTISFQKPQTVGETFPTLSSH